MPAGAQRVHSLLDRVLHLPVFALDVFVVLHPRGIVVEFDGGMNRVRILAGSGS